MTCIASVQNKPTPSALRALRQRDPRLGKAMLRLPAFPGFGNRSSADSHFHSLARTIIYQQLSGNAAATIHDRVMRLTPGLRFPNAEEVQRLSAKRLQKAGLSKGKQKALKDLSARVLNGQLKLRSISRLDDAQIISSLTEVHGIGVWSAEMFLIFRLGRLDVLPAGDLGVQEGLRLLDNLDERPTPSQLAARGECWGPLRSVATWMLYRLVDEQRESN
jgi:DNA-3-methyladenine glycosylase II